jgi:amidase
MKDLSNSTIDSARAALSAGETTAEALAHAFLDRIEKLDRRGPALNSVRTTNPDALAIAAKIDAGRRKSPRPLEGIPILLKDNIATGDKQPTTAGSLALADAKARRDATVTKLLRDAGAVILGKANLTEFANFLALGMPSGYSSLGGQVRNAWAPDLFRDNIPVIQPGGSSAGSGVAVAAGLAVATIGTETAGSLLSPANQSGVVTVKPTVGLISRAGILPISHSQDTAGPMTRTVRDAAILLNVLAQPDPLDAATAKQRRPADFTAGLTADGAKGMRIGVPVAPGDPGQDIYYGPLSKRARKVMDQAIEALADLGAIIVRAPMPVRGWLGAPGTDMPVLNTNPESPARHTVQRTSTVFVYEIRHDLDEYLTEWLRGTKVRSMADIIAFNDAHPQQCLRFGQDLFRAAAATKGDLSEPEYKSARRLDLHTAGRMGMDAYMDEHALDAVLFPGNSGAGIAAKPGYPSVLVPAGFTSGIGKTATPDFPQGATFAGRAWSEAKLLRIAHAFEQATNARRVPAGCEG